MNRPLIIGIGNKAKHGKDLAAKSIMNYFQGKRAWQSVHGVRVAAPWAARIGFADALYDIARREYGMTTKDALLLQKIGEGRRQEFGSNYWLDEVDRKIKANPHFDIVVIPDCRYQNEAAWIKNAMGGYVMNVTRLNKDGSVFTSPDRDPHHISEVDLDRWTWDFKLVNSDGHAALVGEFAITTAEYLWGLHNK